MLGVLLAGCALDYDKEKTTPPDQVPLMVFENLRQTGVKDGRTLYTMESEGSASFPTLKQVRLKRFRFQEYDSTGQTASTGEAEFATIDTGTNDAKITGTLKAHSSDRGVTLVVDGGPSGGLTWANDDRVLKTLPGTGVRLTKDDGSKMEAKALTLDLGTNHLELTEGVQGTWTPEAKHDATTPASPGVPHSGVAADRGR